MSEDIAVFGQIEFAPRALATWKALDASPQRVQWSDFAAASMFEGTVGEALEFFASPAGVWGWKLKIGAKKVTMRGILAGEAFANHGRLIALLWIRAAEAGGVGTVSFRGIGTSDYGAIVACERGASPRAMSDEEKLAADATEEMTALEAFLAQLVEEAESKPAPKKAKKGAALSPSELIDATATGKNKDRVAALTALVAADRAAAERVALAWLGQPVLGDERLYSLVTGAAAAAGQIGTRACLERLVDLVLDGLPEYASFGSRAALTSTKGADAAAAIASRLSDAVIQENPARAFELMQILVKRGEVGDRQRMLEIARDAKRLCQGTNLHESMQEYWANAIGGAAASLLAGR